MCMWLFWGDTRFVLSLNIYRSLLMYIGLFWCILEESYLSRFVRGQRRSHARVSSDLCGCLSIFLRLFCGALFMYVGLFWYVYMYIRLFVYRYTSGNVYRSLLMFVGLFWCMQASFHAYRSLLMYILVSFDVYRSLLICVHVFSCACASLNVLTPLLMYIGLFWCL